MVRAVKTDEPELEGSTLLSSSIEHVKNCLAQDEAVTSLIPLDGNRSNNELSNLVILCPNCHKMHDLDLISTETIIQMRDRPKVVKWSKRMKEAGQQAALYCERHQMRRFV